jgi:tripartite-type tricarboxylate transporter receptor subunit TctC
MSVSTLINARTEKISFAIPRDFTPVIQTYVYARAFFVRKDAPWKTWQDLVKYGRDHKAEITVGTWGPKDFGWLMLTEIEKRENIKFIFAPFSGPGEVMAALLGGHVSASTLTSGWLYVRSGECRALLAFTDRRVESAPDVPCSKELYGLERAVFGGILAPKGLPQPILMKLHNAFRKASEDEDFRKICGKLEMIPTIKSPAEFTKALEEADEATRKALVK